MSVRAAPLSKKLLDRRLFRAVEASDEAAVRERVQSGADPLGRTASGDQAIHFASRLGSLPIVRYLVEECGADVNDVGYDVPPLHWAALSGSVHLMEYLISQGAHVDYVTETASRTALHEAVCRGDINAVNFLI